MIASLASCTAALLATQYIANSIVCRASDIAPCVVNPLDSALHNITRRICDCASESARHI